MAELAFHPDIEAEVKSAFDWYEDKAPGLGDDYLNELESALETVQTLPNIWPKFHLNFRRYNLKRFPFSIIFRETRKTIFVVAIMHNSRKPGYWLYRA